MLRTCGRKLIAVMAVVAIMGAGVLAWLWADRLGAKVSLKTPLSARIILSEKSVVYILIQGVELRAAMSVEGLQTAAPVKFHKKANDFIETPEFPLPIPAAQLPVGVASLKAAFGVAQIRGTPPTPFISCLFKFCRTDDRKVEWEYVARAGGDVSSLAGKWWVLKLPNPDKLRAALNAKLVRGRLAIGLRCTDDDASSLPLIVGRKDGKPVQVSVRVVDSAGKRADEQMSVRLADFGFS